jgi:hypothetical protein
MNSVLRQAELAEREEVKPDQPLFLNQYGTRYKKMRKALKRACRFAAKCCKKVQNRGIKL